MAQDSQQRQALDDAPPAALAAPPQAADALEARAGTADYEAGRSMLSPQSRPLAPQAADADYTVRPGDSLSLIARRVLGDASQWRALYEANRALIGDNPNNIQVGQRLTLPGDDAPAAREAEAEEVEAAPAADTAPAADAADAADAAPATDTAPERAAEAPDLTAQASALATQVARGAAARAPAAEPAAAAEEAAGGAGGAEAAAGGERFEQRAPLGEKDRQLFSHTDPTLGTFEVVLGLDGDLSARAHQRFLSITSQGGLLLRTPAGMSDLVIHRVTLNLDSLEVRIDSEPGIGPLEHEIVSGVLRETMLAQAPDLVSRGKSPLAQAMQGLPRDRGGRHIAYEYEDPIFGASLLQVLFSPDTMATVRFNADALSLGLWPGIEVDTVGPDLTIGTLRYAFASARFEIEQQGSTDVLGVIGDRLKQPLLDGVEAVASRYFRQKLPKAMQAAGYDPTSDPKFTEHLDEVYKNFTGVSLLSGGDTDWADLLGGAEAAALPEGTQVLYTQASPLGPVQVCLPAGDSVSLYKDARHVGLDAGQGIFLDVPGQGWMRDVRLKGIRYDLETGQLDFEGTERMGEFVRSVLEDVVNAHVIPQLPGVARAGLGVGGAGDAEHQTLYSMDVPEVGRVEALLDLDDRLTVSRSPQAIELRAGAGILLREGSGVLPKDTRVQRVHVDLETGQVTIDATPDVGALGETLATKLARALVAPNLPPEMAALMGTLGQPGGAEGAPAAEVPEAEGVVLYAGEVPGVGTFDASIKGADAMQVNASTTRLEISAATGLLIRVPGAGIAVRITGAVIDLESGAVDVTSSVPLGPLEDQLVEGVLRAYGMPMVSQYIQTPTKGDAGDLDVLYTYSSPELGSVSVCVPRGESVSVTKDARAITVRSPGGVQLTGLDWLPDFKLHSVAYELATGRFEVDVSGVVQGHYREGEDVGQMTEDVMASVVRAMVIPHLPPEARALGIGGEEEAAAQQAPAPVAGNKLYASDVPGAGPVAVYLDKNDSLSIAATEKEGLVSSARGLVVDAPALGVNVRLSSIRYHFETGEVQVSGLGALENALLEGAIVEFVTPLLPAEYQQGPTPVQAALGALPTDKKGRRQVMDSNMLTVAIRPGTRFDVAIDGGGLSFTARPGIHVDGPVAFNYQFEGLRFSFATGKFSVDLSRDNLLAGIFTGVARGKAEDTLNEMLLPLLPEHMLTSGYDLMKDPALVATLSQIVERFSAFSAEG